MRVNLRTNKKMLTDEADEGLCKLRKDAGTAYKWTKKKFQMRKLKKMNITDKKVDDKI